jgi:hypothetical protein
LPTAPRSFVPGSAAFKNGGNKTYAQAIASTAAITPEIPNWRSGLAETFSPEPAGVRAYLTGFSEEALAEFQTIQPGAQYAYRCSVHCPLDDLPEILTAIQPDGILYATLCEFQTHTLLPEQDDASAIIGIVGVNGLFKIEARLNRAPLSEDAMAPWLERVIGHPVVYAPLPAFV